VATVLLAARMMLVAALAVVLAVVMTHKIVVQARICRAQVVVGVAKVYVGKTMVTAKTGQFLLQLPLFMDRVPVGASI
tara:strand:- start:262 stop:495 length:234 start_codon:yes stop_codon:yes gene_type:complete